MKDPKSILGPTGRLDLIDFCYELIQRVELNQKHDIELLRGYLVGTANQMPNTTLSALIHGEAFPDAPNEEQQYSIQLLANLMERKYEQVDDLLDRIKNFKEAYQYCREINTGPLNVMKIMSSLFMVVCSVLALFCVYKGWPNEAFRFLFVAVGSLFMELAIGLYIKKLTDKRMQDLIDGKLPKD
jgi:hypothetical protein